MTEQQSTDGTRKFLFRLADGEAIESGRDPGGESRHALHLVAGGVRAAAARSARPGAMGFSRNLEMFEIAGQVREMRLLEPPIDVTNIVFMGMGEPLMNWKAVRPALTILNDPARARDRRAAHHVSTVGVLPGIVALGERPEQFRLAISIHAPSDELRQELMPINTKYPLRRRDRGGEGLRPARHVRVRDARRSERSAASTRSSSPASRANAGRSSI